MCWMVEVEAGLAAGPEADLEAVGAQQEGLQPVEGPVGGPLEGLVGREGPGGVAQEAHNYETYDGVMIATFSLS
jgi:hypothetical protein